jgi:uncharacterized protein YcbX
VSQLCVYPVKSCRGVALEEAEVCATGFVHDRRWLVVDRHGTFKTQRDWPALARISTAIADGGLRLAADGMPPIRIPEPEMTGASRRVTIWHDSCDAITAGPEAAEWLSEFLAAPCQLVMMPDSTVRQVDRSFAESGDRVGFADGFPFLLVSQASLDELNRRLEDPLPMDRFRPNIVVEGCAPHAEDGWRRMTAGPVSFRVVKPCVRCVITTTDQETGERGREPLRTLAAYRRVGREVLFGQNLIHDGSGTIRLGDRCVVTE